MKIFNIENGHKKVYVQISDLAMLDQTESIVPAFVIERLQRTGNVIDDSNRDDFVEFTNPDEIEYFGSIDWIVDYKELIKLPEDELVKRSNAISAEMSDLSTRFMGMSSSERDVNEDLILLYSRLEYKNQSIADIVWFKSCNKPLPLPLIPNSDGFTFVGEADAGYTIKASLDPNKFLMFRTDGNLLSLNDIIPAGFLQSGITLAVMEQNHNETFLGDYEIDYRLSEDSRYFIISFNVKRCEESPKNNKQNPIKKLVNKILGKDKK